MRRIENDCYGCGIHCINCGRKEVEHVYCDCCGEEIDDCYVFASLYDDEICEECAEKMNG